MSSREVGLPNASLIDVAIEVRSRVMLAGSIALTTFSFCWLRPKCADKIRRVFGDRPAGRSVQIPGVVRWLLHSHQQRVLRVECRIVSLRLNVAVHRAGARLGKDLDAPVSQPVIFRRKRILIDANLANRRLRAAVARR